MAAWVNAVTPTRIGSPCALLALTRERSAVARKCVFPVPGGPQTRVRRFVSIW